MPLVPGLSPNLRVNVPEDPAPPDPTDIVVEAANEGGDVPEFDTDGNVIKIEHEDGSISVSLDGKPIEEAAGAGPGEWYENLIDRIDPMECNRIVSDLIRGIEDDLSSRKEWIEDRAVGVKLLGLKIEIPSLQGASDGAPVEGMSKVRHPLLLESVLRFQANARSELLPTDGPVKVRNDSQSGGIETDMQGDALEKDLNHYLTAVATEYYPDTDRMLLMLGFGGSSFKKVYNCPIRNRPVSESVDADDLIVNNNATDLANAKRITHRIYMRPSTVKRLQILGVYNDVDLNSPLAPRLDSLQREEKAQQGLAAEGMNPDDRDREIYEVYCELDIKGFEHKHKGRVTGLEIPYIVTIDVSSQKALAIVRNYPEDTKDLPVARKRFVNYIFTPGFGFYGIGLLHILGNTTNAVTAAWRELLDSGMYANFPGFLMADTGARQNTNMFRVPPGGGALVKTAGMKISDAIMPLPYKEPSVALMQLVQNISDTGQRIGGTSEAMVGEGKQELPVGTALAMIEQAAKVMNAVHKRLHAAQAEEFKLLVECFRENPEAFVKQKCPSRQPWTEQMFISAIQNCDLVPQADPNTASHAQRLVKIMALKELQAANPTLYDPLAIDRAALKAIGWNNPDQFLAPPGAQQQPPPEMQKAIAELQIKKQDSDSKAAVAQATVAKTQAETQKISAEAATGMATGGLAGADGGKQVDTPVDQMLAQADLMDAQTRARDVVQKATFHESEDRNRDLDRQSRERVALLGLAKDIMLHPEMSETARKEVKSVQRDVGMKKP
jgi:hypothetical protein